MSITKPARKTHNIAPTSERQQRERLNKPENSGWTSVDRITKATLNTYNTWIQLSRLQKIYHFQSLNLRLATQALTLEVAHTQQGRDLTIDM